MKEKNEERIRKIQNILMRDFKNKIGKIKIRQFNY